MSTYKGKLSLTIKGIKKTRKYNYITNGFMGIEDNKKS